MAARKSKPREVLSDEPEGPIPSAPRDDEAATPLTKREAAKARCVSLKQAAALLNRDRNTLMKYLSQGLPYVEKADRDRGVSWMLDLGDVVRWLEERAAKNVADRLSAGEGMTEDQAKARTAVAKMITAEAEAAEIVKLVAKIHDMLDLVKKDYTELRLRLVAVPDALAGKVDAKVSDKVRNAAREQIKEALEALKADKGDVPGRG
jgi:phage terminase Nu1 subunit (DNA packaging protein)